MKPGGVWKFMMHGPDGKDYPNLIQVEEVARPERIVLKHAVYPYFTATALFEDMGAGRTKLTYSTSFESADIFNEVKSYAVPGGEQTMDRLAAFVASMAQ